MPHDNRTIIADDPAPVGRRAALVVLVGALLVGTLAAVYYAWAGLTLSHYDARAHLVVARRIVDSLTPGWKQIGAVWLPLPHLLSMPLVQWDWAYRTGYATTALSVLSMAAGLSALTALLVRRTGSVAVGLAAPVLILLNPNVLYLQSTPMTEPLLFGLSLASLLLVGIWIERGDAISCRRAGLALVALSLTRYEGWSIAAALVAFAALARRQDGMRRAFALAPYLAAAVAGFLLLGKGSTGVWFVTAGFFEPDPKLLHSLRASLTHVMMGSARVSSTVVLVVGVAGMILSCRDLLRGRVLDTLPLALVAAAALPLYAFYQGHPFRVRYMVPVVVALGALSARAIAALPRRYQWTAAALIAGAAIWQQPPLDSRAAMVVEAQWERPWREGRTAVTRYLRDHWDGEPILASMGSLGHYMQEASHDGLSLADFLHEGNGELWRLATSAPARYVGWMLIEEQSEGGDVLAVRARSDPTFLMGWDRVIEGRGTALYRRRQRAVPFD